MAYIGKQPVVGNFVKLDAITTSATATYNLLNGGVAYFPQTANNCIVSLNGVIQSPTSAYTISGSTIVFDSALTSDDSIDFILVLGDVLNIGTPSDATVTNAKLALTAGSAGTPTISTAADTNTGIFFPAADTIAFTEGGTEAMRILSDGTVGIGTTSPAYNFSVVKDNYVALFSATNSTAGTSVIVQGSTVHSNNATSSDYFFIGGINAGSDRIYILGNGDLKNTNNSYGAISDIKIKQDIIDASSQWNDIKNVRVRKFRYKNDPTGFLHIGVVAQELEQVSPNLIDEHKDSEKVEVPVLDDNGNPVLNEDGTPQVKEERIPLNTTTKSVKYSILYMKAIKALQEAMERIEQLETKNTSLEARLTALENK
jgi:hypothetical protein